MRNFKKSKRSSFSFSCFVVVLNNSLLFFFVWVLPFTAIIQPQLLYHFNILADIIDHAHLWRCCYPLVVFSWLWEGNCSGILDGNDIEFFRSYFRLRIIYSRRREAHSHFMWHRLQEEPQCRLITPCLPSYSLLVTIHMECLSLTLHLKSLSLRYIQFQHTCTCTCHYP